MEQGEPAIPWYIGSFRELYPLLYSHRDDASARREMDGLVRYLGPAPGARFLDCACGTARHAAAVLELDFDVVGVDLSPDLARAARRRPGFEDRIVLGDMRRLPFAGESFDVVMNLFTSFGYFEREDENAAAFLEMARVLRPGGLLVIDHINRARLEQCLVADSEEERAGLRIRQRRRIDGPPAAARAVKEIEVAGEGGGVRRFMESVRLYEPGDFESLCAMAGIECRAVLGSFDGHRFEPDSERMILVAAKPGPPPRRCGLGGSVELVGFDAVPAFGPGHILDALAKGAENVAGFPLFELDAAPEPSNSPFMDRERLARILSGINASNSGPGADPGCRYVVAGQQAGLLAGPLYTVLKAATVINVAADLERRTGVRHVPLFWIASEDHDLAEVNRIDLHGRRFTAEAPPAGGRGAPAPRLQAADAAHRPRLQAADAGLEPFRDALPAFLEDALPAADPYKAHVLDLVRGASFDSFAAHFADMMRALFRDLWLVDPLALRPLTSPVLAALVERWPEVERAFRAGTELLKTRGFDPPLAEPGFFEIAGGERCKCIVNGDGVVLSDGKHTLKETAEIIRGNPGEFSPNAALRPVLQDAVIPVAAFAAGPSELLYLWQIDGIYAAAGVQRSRLLPRVSATFVEPGVRRAARKLNLGGAALFAAHAMLAGAAGSGAEAAPDADAGAIRESAQRTLSILDALLKDNRDKPLERSRDSLAAHVEKICARVRLINAGRIGRERRLLETAARAVLPGGKLQERAANVFELYSRHGPALIDLMVRRLNPWADAHHIVDLVPARRDDGGGGPQQGDPA